MHGLESQGTKYDDCQRPQSGCSHLPNPYNGGNYNNEQRKMERNLRPKKLMDSMAQGKE